MTKLPPLYKTLYFPEISRDYLSLSLPLSLISLSKKHIAAGEMEPSPPPTETTTTTQNLRTLTGDHHHHAKSSNLGWKSIGSYHRLDLSSESSSDSTYQELTDTLLAQVGALITVFR
jgi:hypothetical protein